VFQPLIPDHADRSPDTIALRSYTPADFDKLYIIDQACYDPRIAYSRTDLRRFLRFPGADCVLAELPNAGPVAVGFCITAYKGTWGYMITMDVIARHRRGGVGSLLLAEAERRLASCGVRQIGLETATTNAAAIAFWQKHGYRKSGVRKNYYPGPCDAFTMVKRLGAGEAARKAKRHS
jgi:[ribosomal protein S18]-alanine N-acetyltransferase